MKTSNFALLVLGLPLLYVSILGCSGNTSSNPVPPSTHAALVPNDSLIVAASIRVGQILDKAGGREQIQKLLDAGLNEELSAEAFQNTLLDPAFTGIDPAQPVYFFLELDVPEEIIQKLADNRTPEPPDWEPPEYPENAGPTLGATFAIADVDKFEEWSSDEDRTWQDQGDLRLLKVDGKYALLAHDGKSGLFVAAPKGKIFTSPEKRFAKAAQKQPTRPPYLQDLFSGRDDVAVFVAGKRLFDTLIIAGGGYELLPLTAWMDSEALLQANASDGALNMDLKLDRGRYRDTFAPMPEERYTPEEVAEFFATVVGTWKITGKGKPHEGEETEVDGNMTLYGHESGKSLIRHVEFETGSLFTLEEYHPRTGAFVGKSRPVRGRPARLSLLYRDLETQVGRLLHDTQRHLRNPDDINSSFKRVDKDQFEREIIVSKDGKTIFSGTYLNRRTASGDPRPICVEDEFDPTLLELLDAKAILNVHLREDLAHTITTDNPLLEVFYQCNPYVDRLNYQEFAERLGYTLPELVQTFTGQAILSLHGLPEDDGRNELPGFTLALVTRPPAEKVRARLLKKLLAKTLPSLDEDAREPLVPPALLANLSIAAKGNHLIISTKDRAEQAQSGKSDNPLTPATKAWFAEGNQRMDLNIPVLAKALVSSGIDEEDLPPLETLSALKVKHANTGVLTEHTELELKFTKSNVNALRQIVQIIIEAARL